MLLLSTLIHNVTRDMETVSCTADNGLDRPAEYVKLVTVSDAGEYFCNAENSLASATAVTSVEVRTEDERPHFSSLEACCKLRNVSVDCMGVCQGQAGLSYEALEARPQCLLHYEAIIGCGSEAGGDAGEHKACCYEVGVSPVCQTWCGAKREEDLDLSYSAEICAMSYAEKIMG